MKRLRLMRSLIRIERSQTRWRYSRPRLWIRGFYSDRIDLYPNVTKRSMDYISDWSYETRSAIINPTSVRSLLRDKLAFEYHLSETQIARPRHYGEILGGKLRLQISPGLIRESGAIVKPRFGAEGRDVTLVYSLKELQDVASKGGDWVIQERVRQAEYSSDINSPSLNTIRIQVIRSPRNGQPIMVGAAHRFGSRTTGIVDNASAGGYVASVQLQSGKLGEIVFSTPSGGGRSTSTHHPDSGAVVTGVTVPGWNDVEGLMLQLMEAIPEAINVGVDIALSADGPLVIEANGNPSPGLLQRHGSFLDRSPEIREFFVRHGLARDNRPRSNPA